jgi:hypothetical protein
LKSIYFSAKPSVYKFPRKDFALQFLPADHIPPAFEKLKEKSTDEKTQEIMQYQHGVSSTNP